MRNLIDLHIHTTHSDGDKTPLEIVDIVRKSDVYMFSITDHDSIRGVKELSDFKDNELIFLSGVELSAKLNENEEGNMHILGYQFDFNDIELNKKLNELKQRRIIRAQNIFKFIHDKYQIHIPTKDIDELLQQDHNIGRPDIAKLCLIHGYVSTIQEAFVNYLNEAEKKFRDMKSEPKECISLILKAGGLPILAHPHSLKKGHFELMELVEELKSYGLAGLEVYHSNHSENDTKNFMKIVNHFNLLYTAGTDYHGGLKPDVEIGTGRNNNVKIKKINLHK